MFGGTFVMPFDTLGKVQDFSDFFSSLGGLLGIPFDFLDF